MKTLTSTKGPRALLGLLAMLLAFCVGADSAEEKPGARPERTRPDIRSKVERDVKTESTRQVSKPREVSTSETVKAPKEKDVKIESTSANRPEAKVERTQKDVSADSKPKVGQERKVVEPPAEKLSKVEKSKTEEKIGTFTKITEVRPGRDPGQSRAEYTWFKNANGEVVRTYKDSYDRANNWMGRKPLRGGPEGRKP